MAAVVRSIVSGKHIPAGLFITIGGFLIVTEVNVLLLQVPFVKKYITVYTPSVLAARLISPVVAFKLKPGEETKFPPPIPVRLTIAVPFLQYGEPV